jgi:hypothetical protein
MQKTYKLKQGEISFDEAGIIIKDNAKKLFRTRIFSSSLWTFFGIMSVLRYMNTKDQFLLWTGLFIGIAHFIILVLTLFISSKQEIKMDEIKSMELKRRSGHYFLDIKLTGNKIRRVNQVDDIKPELESYIETYFRQHNQ